MKWKVLPKVSADLKSQLLANRGLKSKSAIENFLHPALKKYQKELEIPGINKASARIKKAIKNSEQIICYGDYDVDGICATAIIYKALSSIGANILPFIPHRERDGYGLSTVGLDAIKLKYPETKLVITVDNGIVAVEQIKYAKKMGFDVIITDHHLPLEELPKAGAIVHSIKMCGAGVAWCLARVLVSKELSQELLQFVAIGTIADQMELVGLGRALAVEGLVEINKTSNPGLRALIGVTNLEFGKIGSYEIGHIIGPRLNAAGRMDTAMPALKLLCTNNPNKALDFAEQLMEANTSRQDLTIKAIEEASLQIDKNGHVHVVVSPNWIPGIIGLIAARLSEEYSRPAIAISVGETMAKGSARSIPGVNIVESLRQCRELLIDVGGHAGAAGFSLESKNVELLKIKLEELIIKQEAVEKELEIEAILATKELNRKLLDLLEEFEPFGAGNPKPVFGSKNMKITDIKSVGGGKHLKFLADGIEAIAFGRGELRGILKEGQLLSVAYNLELNTFNGNSRLQLKVKDIGLL